MTAASASAPERTAQAPADHGRLRTYAGVAGIALSIAYLVAPSDLVVLRELVFYPAVEIGAGVAILVGVWLYRPEAPSAWRLIAAGIFAFAVGDVIWGFFTAVGDGAPYPSAADLLYLAGYPLLGAGLVIAVQRRSALFQRALALDTAGIVCVGLFLMWVYVLRPVVEDDSLGTAAKIVSLAYPCGDLILFAITLRFALGGGLRSRALQLLVLGLGFQLAADIGYAGNAEANTRAVAALYLAALVCIGIAALLPSMRDLTESNVEGSWLPTRAKLLTYGAVAIVPAAVLVIEGVRDRPLPIWGFVVTSVLILAVVILRLEGLILDAERTAAHEKALGDYSAELMEHVGDGDLVQLADRTVAQLVSPGRAGAAELPAASPAPHALRVPVLVEGRPAAEVYADVLPQQAEQVGQQLATVASQLALALTRERLHRREQESAASLLEQNERLRELDELKNRFVSSASHELRTPLAAIVGYLELVLGGEAGELTDQQKEFLEIIDRNCDRLNKLVDDILFMGRVDSDRLTLEPQPVDLAGLAGTEVESMRAAAERKAVGIALDAPHDVPALEGDPTRLTQLLDNLISNAVKFTPEGGTVTVAVSADPDAVSVAVHDTGVGIPADELPRIFERFFRASTAASSGVSGTGIGLAIVQSIAEAHGGSVAAESEVGAGTTFTVTLPLHPAPETLIMKAVREKSEAGAG